MLTILFHKFLLKIVPNDFLNNVIYWSESFNIVNSISLEESLGENKKFFVFHDWGVSVYEPQNCRLLHMIQSTDIMPGTQVRDFLSIFQMLTSTCTVSPRVSAQHQYCRWCVFPAHSAHGALMSKLSLKIFQMFKIIALSFLTIPSCLTCSI